MVVDFRKNAAPPSPLTLCNSPVTTVDSFRFLGSIITQDLKWELKTMMVHFYTAIIESILCSSITVWYAAATAKDKGRFQCVIRSAEGVIGCNLPSLQDLFAARTLKRARKIVADPSHPGHELFVPLPSGRRLRSIRT
ncbi:uncharacterized protein ACO6RY_13481 [Pungitius sinensis]